MSDLNPTVALDRIARALERIATAVERLAPPVPLPEPAPCARCGGLGYLGNPMVPCHACDGTGRQPASQA